eukprot:CAMPEP_0171267626 /NCGR_PEP_ID=MMETSP0790-20130122/59254_1 /TAXON_ID=2925 /ORGANISM="Alexandrium catenella, Strain OF101" /LENGTH=124 /DNA_ID=CAMNT_0011736365 /DNA_START=48 /DNA_END=419 /DNA_ORIENTATION=+
MWDAVMGAMDCYLRSSQCTGEARSDRLQAHALATGSFEGSKPCSVCFLKDEIRRLPRGHSRVRATCQLLSASCFVAALQYQQRDGQTAPYAAPSGSLGRSRRTIGRPTIFRARAAAVARRGAAA